MLSPEHLSEREVAESVSPAVFCARCLSRCEVFQHGGWEREPVSGPEVLHSWWAASFPMLLKTARASHGFLSLR